MRRTSLTTLALSLTMIFAIACSGDKSEDAGTGPADSGVPPDTGEPPDAGGGFPDAEPAEAGPMPCFQDQKSEANDQRGCDPGFVCNLAMNPPQCVPGRACNTDTECNVCSDLQNPQDCGHGYNVVAYCDARHAAEGTGGTCTRSRAPCEVCEVDEDCGRNHVLIGGAESKCLDYGDGNKYCGRACGSCPQGFLCDTQTSQCRRDECAPVPSFCPTDTPPIACMNAGQICRGEECPGTGGALCSTNDVPGAIGTCIGFCNDNTDCPPESPICNTRNGVCITGCTKDSCAAGLTCHLDGFCRAPCPDNADCVTRFGADAYCNDPGQDVAPRYYKEYHDASSCQKLGCENKTDCEVANVVCDKLQSPPTCVPGCFENGDCDTFFCRSTGGQLPRPTYSQAECRALPEKTDMNEIGVCCDPGCLDRRLDCAQNEFCCGEQHSPYEESASCLALTSTGGPQAVPGDCFEMPVTDPWCHACEGHEDCNSGYTAGYNVDPNINGGQPFEEQEFCTVAGVNPVTMTPAVICQVTCNPNNLDDNQCPASWICEPMYPGCRQAADCSGLECIGFRENDPSTPDDDTLGKCKCGEGGTASGTCPSVYPTVNVAIDYPRCIDFFNSGGDMYCASAYNCTPPGVRYNNQGVATNWPLNCNFP